MLRCVVLLQEQKPLGVEGRLGDLHTGSRRNVHAQGVVDMQPSLRPVRQ